MVERADQVALGQRLDGAGAVRRLDHRAGGKAGDAEGVQLLPAVELARKDAAQLHGRPVREGKDRADDRAARVAQRRDGPGRPRAKEIGHVHGIAVPVHHPADVKLVLGGDDAGGAGHRARKPRHRVGAAVVADHQRVGGAVPRPEVDRVVARAGIDPVGPGPGLDRVRAAPAPDGVGARSPHDRIVPRPADDGVVAGPGVDVDAARRHRRGVDRVVPRPGGHPLDLGEPIARAAPGQRAGLAAGVVDGDARGDRRRIDPVDIGPARGHALAAGDGGRAGARLHGIEAEDVRIVLTPRRIAAADNDGVGAVATLEHVVVVPAVERIRLGAAEQRVGAIIAPQRVRPGTAVNRVGPRAAEHGVIACRRLDPVIAVAAIEHIVP